MLSIFVFALALGGALILLQLALGLGGLSHDSPDAGHLAHGGHGGHGSHEHGAGLNLLSVRTVAAGVAFFGGAGWAALAAGLPTPAAVVLAVVLGFAALVGAAYLMRSLLRLESDGTPVIDGAVGLPAKVYLAVPGGRAGVGKIHVTLQNRTVEYQAVSSQDDLPTGADVIVVDVLGPDTVEVVPTPTLLGDVDA